MNILEILLFDRLGVFLHTFWAFRLGEAPFRKVLHLGFVSFFLRQEPA